MAKDTKQNYVRVSREEYLRLKQLQSRFELFLNYVDHLKDIQKGRHDIQQGRMISQEEIFKELGI